MLNQHRWRLKLADLIPALGKNLMFVGLYLPATTRRQHRFGYNAVTFRYNIGTALGQLLLFAGILMIGKSFELVSVL